MPRKQKPWIAVVNVCQEKNLKTTSYFSKLTRPITLDEYAMLSC